MAATLHISKIKLVFMFFLPPRDITVLTVDVSLKPRKLKYLHQDFFTIRRPHLVWNICCCFFCPWSWKYWTEIWAIISVWLLTHLFKFDPELVALTKLYMIHNFVKATMRLMNPMKTPIQMKANVKLLEISLNIIFNCCTW